MEESAHVDCVRVRDRLDERCHLSGECIRKTLALPRELCLRIRVATQVAHIDRILAVDVTICARRERLVAAKAMPWKL